MNPTFCRTRSRAENGGLRLATAPRGTLLRHVTLRRLLLLVLPSLLGGLLLADSTNVNQTPPAATAGRQLIPASDARFRYEGWFDFTDRTRPVVVWQGSRISLDFDGPLLVLHFAPMKAA